MTSVRIGVFAPSSTGDDRRPSGSIEWRPTRRRTVSGDVVLPAPFTVGLLATAPVIEVAPTGADWVWRVVERVQGGAPDYRYLVVPNLGTVVDYASLVEVDPATLDPLAPLSPAWAASLAAGLAPKANIADLAPVATAGTYASLTGKPTIPAVPADIGADPAGAATAAQAAAVQRANHTGTQSADTLTDGTTNKAFTATERTKLTGVAIGATANATDTALRDRSTHTGTQPASTVTGLAPVATSGAYTDLTGRPTIPAPTTSASDLTAGTLAVARIADGSIPAAKLAPDVATQAELDTAAAGLNTRLQAAEADLAAATPVDNAGALIRRNEFAGFASPYIQLWNDPAGVEHAARKSYVDGQVAGKASSTDPRLSDTRVPTDGTVTDVKVAAGAAIALSKLATNPLARANHTGTQAASTVTGLAAVATSGAYADLTGAPGAVGATDTLTAGESTISRYSATTTFQPPSGQLRLAYFTATKTETVNNVRVVNGTAAAATPTLVRVGIYSVAADGTLTLVGSTANDTTVFATANSSYTRALAAAFTKTSGQRYAMGALVVSAATMPALPCVVWSGPTAEVNTVAPRLVAAITGLTDLPATVAPGTINNGAAQIPYLTVLP